MGKNYMESSLKKFLKRKVKITLGIVVAFLITGSIAFSVSIEESDLINNTYTNNDVIKQLGVNLKDVGYEKINIINNGEISLVGTGGYSSAFIVSSSYHTACFVGDFTNFGTIKSYSENLSSNGLFNGNGIGLDNSYSYIELGNIKNRGTISGEVGNSDVSLTYSGNGIFLGLRNPSYDFQDAYIKLGNVTNSGTIKGKSGFNIHGAQILGNGIGVFIANDDHRGDEKVGDSNIGNIINSGNISGTVEGTFNSAGDRGKTTLTGNGIGVSISYEYTNTGTISGNISIGDIQNTGIIEGEHREIASNFGNDSAIVSGNGIGVITLGFSDYGDYGKFNLKGVNNKGIISGTVNNIEAHGMVIGNGLGFHGKKVKITSDIFNDGIIKGNVKSILNNGTNIGNGIGISSNYGGLNLKNIVNTGILSGKIDNGKLEQGTVFGNGLGLEGESITLADISNGGFVKGILNLDRNSGENFGNGIGITSSAEKITLNSIKNTGAIVGITEGTLSGKGAGNGIGIYGKNIELTSNISNDGLIIGKIQNSQKDTTTSGNGIGITAFDGKVKLNDIKNTGFINSIVEENTLGTNVGNGLGIYGKNIQVGNIENEGKIKSSFIKKSELNGNGLAITSTDNSLNVLSVKNKGTIIGNNIGINISKNNTAGELANYSNGGIIVGKTPIYAQGFIDNFNKSADKGIAIILDNQGEVKEIINGVSGEIDGKVIINADIIGKDSFISVDKKTSYNNNIINGAGINSGTLNINAETDINNSIINAYKNAITDVGNNDISINSSIINGNIALSNGNSKLNIANSQLNGNISGGEGKDTLTIGRLNFFQKIEGFEDIIFKGNTTLYETSKVLGANKIEIDSGTEVNLRVDSSKKGEDNTYKEHALFNSSNQKLILSGNTNAITGNDVDENGNFSVVENKDKLKYDKVSILNIITNGLGINAKVDLGNTKVEDNLWVKTDSILNQATKQENEKGTILTIEAEKDLFNIIKKIEKPVPKPEVALTPLEPAIPTNPKPEIPSTPLEPSKPINPDKPNEYDKYENLYVKLNEIYKGVHTSNDRNFNALNYIVTNYTFGDKDKGDYPIIGNEKMQMANLLGYLRSIYEETPYSFSNESTRKSMGLFHDTVRDNNFKAKKDEWFIYGGLVHQNGDQEQTYYGRNYHGFDTGTADTDAEIKLTGAYGQFEYGSTDTLSTGIMVGGTKSDVEVASSKLEGTGAYVGVYAKKDIKDLRLTAGAGYQYTEYDGTRRTINETYSEDYKDEALNLYLDGKYSYDLGNNFYFEPKAGLSYTHIDQDGIKESNDKALSLNIDSKEFDVLEGIVGVDIKKVIPTEKGKHSVSAGLSYRHILDGADADYLTADFGGQDFEILVPHKNKGQMSIGVRYETELENGMFYDVKGNYFVNVDSKENSNKNADKGEWRVGAGIGYKFSTLKDLL